MPNLNELVRLARRETGTWTAGDLAKLLGCSRSTVQRSSRTEGLSRGGHYEILIKTVHPKNPGLAIQLAAARSTTLEKLGLAGQAFAGGGRVDAAAARVGRRAAALAFTVSRKRKMASFVTSGRCDCG
jgi:hypothetical protein